MNFGCIESKSEFDLLEYIHKILRQLLSSWGMTNNSFNLKNMKNTILYIITYIINTSDVDYQCMAVCNHVYLLPCELHEISGMPYIDIF